MLYRNLDELAPDQWVKISVPILEHHMELIDLALELTSE